MSHYGGHKISRDLVGWIRTTLSYRSVKFDVNKFYGSKNIRFFLGNVPRSQKVTLVGGWGPFTQFHNLAKFNSHRCCGITDINFFCHLIRSNQKFMWHCEWGFPGSCHDCVKFGGSSPNGDETIPTPIPVPISMKSDAEVLIPMFTKGL